MNKVNYIGEIENEQQQRELTVHDFLIMSAFFPSDINDCVRRLRQRWRSCESCVFAPDRKTLDCYLHDDPWCNTWYRKQVEKCSTQAEIDKINRLISCREQRCRDKLYDFLKTPLSEKGLVLFRDKEKEIKSL